MKAQDYEIFREASPLDEISFGYRTVTLFRAAALSNAQIGYSIGPNGEDLTGTKPGDWLCEWFVIATEDLNGDPIFIDLERKKTPVYTAIHGIGKWCPVKIASSLPGFLAALRIIDSIGQQRRNPVQFQKHPLSDEDKLEGITNIGKATKITTSDFWLDWFEG